VDPRRWRRRGEGSWEQLGRLVLSRWTFLSRYGAGTPRPNDSGRFCCVGSSYRAVRRLFFGPGGRPGPRRRRRRRPFFAGFVGERLPNRLAIALRTSVCTSSRMTVMMLLRRGIPHLPATDACPI
jgi:hypothetical protein